MKVNLEVSKDRHDDKTKQNRDIMVESLSKKLFHPPDEIRELFIEVLTDTDQFDLTFDNTSYGLRNLYREWAKDILTLFDDNRPTDDCSDTYYRDVDGKKLYTGHIIEDTMGGRGLVKRKDNSKGKIGELEYLPYIKAFNGHKDMFPVTYPIKIVGHISNWDGDWRECQQYANYLVYITFKDKGE